ncbi:hypothetical protein O1Q96_33845 [Streptomyces sp. Qhu-G9]|nr:hypothetical protein [Streptomyces aurantiacus]WAU84235.1 hypothetical protein O1Q96_33845 [Streptomyces aurantiacus]
MTAAVSSAVTAVPAAQGHVERRESVAAGVGDVSVPRPTSEVFPA